MSSSSFEAVYRVGDSEKLGLISYDLSFKSDRAPIIEQRPQIIFPADDELYRAAMCHEDEESGFKG